MATERVSPSVEERAEALKLRTLPIETRYRRIDPDTSIEAIQEIYDEPGKLSQIQTRVYRTYAEAGANGLSHYELTERISIEDNNPGHMNRSTFRTRAAELEKMGHLKWTGKTRRAAGRNRRVYALARYVEDTSS